MKSRIIRALGIAALASFTATPALAVDATDTFNVTVTVTDSCTVAATDLDFGAFDPGSLIDTLGLTTVNVTCTLGTIFTTSYGGGSSGDPEARTMLGDTNPANTIGYSLCDDPACLSILGDGTGTTVTIPGVGLGLAPIPMVVNGLIPAGQDVPADTYTDTITVTVTY